MEREERKLACRVPPRIAPALHACQACGVLNHLQVSHDRVKQLDRVFRKGERVRVLVLNVDDERGRFTLSTKALERTSGGCGGPERGGSVLRARVLLRSMNSLRLHWLWGRRYAWLTSPCVVPCGSPRSGDMLRDPQLVYQHAEKAVAEWKARQAW